MATHHREGTISREPWPSSRVHPPPCTGPVSGVHSCLPASPGPHTLRSCCPRSVSAPCTAFLWLPSSSLGPRRPYVASGPGLLAIFSSHFPGSLHCRPSGLLAVFSCTDPLSPASAPASPLIVTVCWETMARAQRSLSEHLITEELESVARLSYGELLSKGVHVLNFINTTTLPQRDFIKLIMTTVVRIACFSIPSC